jgi:hypothetical protein
VTRWFRWGLSVGHPTRSGVPAKHNGLLYGFLGGLAGAVVWFGGWSLLHQEQVRRYPEHCSHAIHSTLGGLTLFVRSRCGNER